MGGSVGRRGRSVVGTSNAAAKKQRDHYEKIHREYAAHYYDKWSMEFRDRFINAAIFEDVELENTRIAEIMCGDGPLTSYLISQDRPHRYIGF